MHVYWKNNAGKLAQMTMEDPGIDHEEAILMVKEFLVQSGEGYNGAVLALAGGTLVQG